MSAWLIKYRNLLLLGLLVIMLIVSAVRGTDVPSARDSVALPVIYTVQQEAMSPMERYRASRDEAAIHDMAALQVLCDNERLDVATRTSAAEALLALTKARSIQQAMEGALLNTALAPCVAVYSNDCLTIVTDKSELTDDENTQLLMLAEAHAGVQPANVRVVCGQAGPGD